MLRIAFAALLLSTLPAISQTAAPAPAKSPKAAKAAPTDPLLGEARAAIAGTLKDPAAAQFQNVRVRDGTDKQGRPFKVVCGDVNGKNSYGAYSGFAPWAYLSNLRRPFVLGQSDVATPDVLKMYCSN